MTQTHDYTRRHWGHDYSISPNEDGSKADLIGWGHGISKGDYLLLQHDDGSTRYLVEQVKYMSNPKDMWEIKASFAPRTIKEKMSDEGLIASPKLEAIAKGCLEKE